LQNQENELFMEGLNDDDLWKIWLFTDSWDKAACEFC
jgi:hypothetical protein